MAWIKLTMKFPGKCMECGKPIPAGQPGLWLKGVGVKHVQCATSEDMDSSDTSVPVVNRIMCSLCGKSAGCSECEFQDNCDIANVSPSCLCAPCSQKNDVLSLYHVSVGKKFPILIEDAPKKDTSPKYTNARLF